MENLETCDSNKAIITQDSLCLLTKVYQLYRSASKTDETKKIQSKSEIAGRDTEMLSRLYHPFFYEWRRAKRAVAVAVQQIKILCEKCMFINDYNPHACKDYCVVLQN